MHGFDKDYFTQQVAGLSQLAGELMLVKAVVIDLGWGGFEVGAGKAFGFRIRCA